MQWAAGCFPLSVRRIAVMSQATWIKYNSPDVILLHNIYRFPVITPSRPVDSTISLHIAWKCWCRQEKRGTAKLNYQLEVTVVISCRSFPAPVKLTRKNLFPFKGQQFAQFSAVYNMQASSMLLAVTVILVNMWHLMWSKDRKEWM